MLARLRSFKHALNGLRILLKTQPNARIHVAATVAVIIAGCAFGITRGDWCLVIFACAGVWVAEALNTAVEFLGDAITTEKHPLIGKAKDVAACAVLLAALAAVGIGVFVFAPHLF